MERLGSVLAYEISKTLIFTEKEIETPLGIAKCKVPEQEVVLGTILRAGLPMHQGMLRIFDHATNAFVSAYRKQHKDGSFDVHLEYVSCPDLEGKILVLADPMLATGASMKVALENLMEYGKPSKVHLVTAIAATPGLNQMKRLFPDASIWMGAIDEELTAKSYIVPGLGDAGDLAYGEKVQE
jgi:uracil phosphoribosyltransferase